MKHLKLRIVSDHGIEATISSNGSCGNFDDYFSIVSIDGVMADTKIYGGDPIQSFAEAMKLIAALTEDKRIGGDGDDPMPGTTWHIEIAEE